ncbi:MAG: sensor histidine kinase [Oscillospiraceae bacterium]
MGTISRADSGSGRRFISIRTKFLLTYISLIAVVIVILNTYPVIISRNLVFISKCNTIKSQAIQIGTSIEVLERVTPDTVSHVMNMLETSGISRITVVNADYDELYSDSTGDGGYEESVSYNLISKALLGSDEFVSYFEGGAFKSYSAAPLMTDGHIIGAVCIYEYDRNEGEILIGLRNDLLKISVALSVLAVLLSVVYSRTFTHRITKILDAIVNVREGEYTYRIDVVGHDELAQLSDEFNSLTNRLQNTEEIRRRFVADASHELKTPLAAIRLLSDSILQSSNIDSDTVKEFVSDIREESERLARTTSQLLDLTKLDNKITTVRSCVDCTEVGSRVIRSLRPIAKERSVELQCVFDPECFIMATDDELFQIIFNLTENAIKYNFKGGKVVVNICRKEKNVVISVEDTGIGIPAQDLPYIFDRFYRVDKSRDREDGGSGLGLSIVKSTAERHGGEVEAQRLEDGGMKFIVIFPLYSPGTKVV